jgi:hypothetical protein
VVIEVQIVVPPGQGTSSAFVSMSRPEATSLRDALDLMLTTGSSGWHAYLSWADFETDVSLILETENPTDPTALPDGTTRGP